MTKCKETRHASRYSKNRKHVENTCGGLLIHLLRDVKYNNCEKYIYKKDTMIGGASLVTQRVNNLPAMQEIPGSGRCPGEGNGSPFQYSCLENSMDRGAWWATDHGVAMSWT